MLNKLKNRLKDEDYDLSFQKFIKRINIREDFKKYEDAYVNNAISKFNKYVESPEWSDAKKEFKNKELVKEAKSNLKNYIISLVNSTMLWGYDRAYNLVPNISLPVAKMIASCTGILRVDPEIKNECETGRVVSSLSVISSSSPTGEYGKYIDTLDRKMESWLVHYLNKNTLKSVDGVITGSDSSSWKAFIRCASHILTHIAIYKVFPRDYYVMSMHSIFEIASLRFVLQELKDVLDIRVFYDGCDSFPKEIYQSIFENRHTWNPIVFGDTYADCYTKSALNDIWDDSFNYHTLAFALYNESLYLSVEASEDADMKLNKIGLIADAIYDKDSYLIVNKGTEAEKNIDQIIKSNPEYSAFYSVEL